MQFKVTESNRFPMPTSSTPVTNLAHQPELGSRRFSLRLPPPSVTVAVLIGSVFLLRLPSALVPRELNVDESVFLSQAMKFLVDPRPWVSVDPSTSGPLNSYLISVLLLLGFKPGFVLIHMLASALVCLQVFVAYLTLRRLGSEKTAAVGAFLMVVLYGLATHKDYLHYAGEWLPSLLLMVGFYIFVVWLDNSAGRRMGAQLCLLFSVGLVLGTAPWCKLQAGPITGALGLVVLAAIFKDKEADVSFSRRVKGLIAFGGGGVLTTCVMLAILAKTDAVKDFWYSYIQGNVAYAGTLSLITSIEDFLVICVSWPLRQPLLIALVGLGLLVQGPTRTDILLLFKKNKWAFSGLLAYAASALFAICRVRYPLHHHTLFLVPPMTYLAAVAFTVPPKLPDLTRRRRSSKRLVFAVVLIVAFATIGGIRYASMISAIVELSHSQPDQNPRTSKLVHGLPERVSDDRMAKIRRAFIASDWPRYWWVEDSNERIANIVGDIQRTRRVRSLAIWGWAPGVYVLTGIPPATRDSIISSLEIKQGPMRRYLRERFVSDLRARPPDLFVDAVAPDALMWHWTENDSYESDPELREFVEDNYILVDELTLIEGAHSVRFFARREPTS